MSAQTRTSRHELRRFFRRARRALAPARQTDNARAVARHLQVSGLLFTRGAVAAYLPHQLDGELDTVPILQRLWSTQHTVAVPVVPTSRAGTTTSQTSSSFGRTPVTNVDGLMT